MAAIGERRSHTDTEGGSLGDGYPLREGPPLHCMAEPRRPGKGSVCGVKRSSIESNDSVTARDTFCPLLAGVAGCASCGVGGARACAGCVDWANKPSKLIGVASCASYGVGGARACAACVDWANKSSKWIGVAFDDPLPFICPEEMPKGRPKGCPKGCSKGCSRDAQGTICNANRRKFQV